MPNFTADALAQINAFRSQPRICGSTSLPAAPPLTWNGPLTAAARGHSTDMAAKGYFSHTSQDGRSFDQRVTAAGYAWRAVGENIAAGQSTMAQVMAGWQQSEGHCRNLMASTYADVGLACVKGGAGAPYRTYWTMDLGRR